MSRNPLKTGHVASMSPSCRTETVVNPICMTYFVNIKLTQKEPRCE